MKNVPQKLSMSDIDNLYKPLEIMLENQEAVEPVKSEVPAITRNETIEVSIFGSKLEPVLGKVYLGQFLGIEDIESSDENGVVTYFKSCNFIVETLQANGIKLYEKKYVSTTTFLNSAEKGLIIPNEWYKLEYLGEAGTGTRKFHKWNILHVRKI